MRTTIKLILIACLLLVQGVSLAQNGFTNKDEAKNITDANGLKQGKWIEYLNQSLSFTTSDSFMYYILTIYKDDVPQKTQRIYNSNNQEINERAYYENGLLAFDIPFLNSKRNGVVKGYSETTGRLIYATSYTDDIPDMSSVKTYEDWIQDGITVSHLNGKIADETFFENGNKVWVKNYLDGQLSMQRWYENGKKTKTKTYKLIKGSDADIMQKQLEHEVSVIVHKQMKKEFFDALKDPKTWQGIAVGVLQGAQQAVAFQEYNNNPNSQTASNYMNIAKNNLTMKQEDALKANNKVLGSSAANNGIKPERSATTNGGNSTSSGNSSITDAYNKNLIKTNEIYNSSHPNNPINPLQGTVNYSGGKATVESSATSNNGNTTSSGKDGNSPEGIACAKEAQSEYEHTREYHDYNDNKNNINAPVLRYGELAKAKNAEVLLQHCSQYLNAQEQAMLISVSSSCRKNASEMNGNTIQH